MKDHLVRRRCLADEARLPANSQHQGSRHVREVILHAPAHQAAQLTPCGTELNHLCYAWPELLTHSVSKNMTDVLSYWNKQTKNDMILQHIPQGQTCFSLASFVVHEFLHVDLFDCLLPLALGEEASENLLEIEYSVRTQLIKHL